MHPHGLWGDPSTSLLKVVEGLHICITYSCLEVWARSLLSDPVRTAFNEPQNPCAHCLEKCLWECSVLTPAVHLSSGDFERMPASLHQKSGANWPEVGV